jgi:hypothetical protein
MAPALDPEDARARWNDDVGQRIEAGLGQWRKRSPSV